MYLAVVAAITGQALAMGQPVLLGYAAVWVTSPHSSAGMRSRPWPANSTRSTRHTVAAFQPGGHEPGHGSRARHTAMAPPLTWWGSIARACRWPIPGPVVFLVLVANPTEQCHLPSG